MRIAIAADHNALTMKSHLVAWLEAQGHEVDDRGTHGHAEVDYPALCEDVSRKVAGRESDRGIVLGGSGQGEVVACNKFAGIRAGVCHTRFGTEISRGNNDANVLVMGAKVVSVQEAEEITETWLATPFKGGRHQRRLDQIAALERGESLLTGQDDERSRRDT
jgi:ribose 5-phosphate isomerase B